MRQLAMHLADMAGLIIGADAPEQTVQQNTSPQFIRVSARVASIITIPSAASPSSSEPSWPTPTGLWIAGTMITAWTA